MPTAKKDGGSPKHRADSLQATARQIATSLRDRWAPLVITDLLFKVFAFAVLTPIVAILFRGFIELGGRRVLTDLDIVVFFAGSPIGVACFVVVGGLWLAIIALEYAALLSVLDSPIVSGRAGAVAAIAFALSKLRPILALTWRICLWSLLAAIPFLGAATIVYRSLLGNYDINYYLAEKPPEFIWAVVFGGLIGVGLSTLLLRLWSGWLYSLPIAILEGASPAEALHTSRSFARGRRARLIGWLTAWFLSATAISLLVTFIGGWTGRVVLPYAITSIPKTLLASGAIVLVVAAVNLAVNLFGTLTLAAIVFTLHRQLRAQENTESPTKASTGVAEPTDSAETDGLRRRLGFGKLAIAATAAALASLIVGWVAVGSVQLEDRTEVTAHRGASLAAPENTLAAVEAALKAGADWVEIDVQETADGRVVVFHDSDFKRLSGADLKIWDATMADLHDLDVGSYLDVGYAQQRVPTLEQVLRACRGKAGVNIELKYYGRQQQLEQRVANVVELCGMEDDVVLMSLDRAGVERMSALRPDWHVGLLAGRAVGDLSVADADFLAVHGSLATRDFISRAHRRGKPVHVWTINDPLSMSIMIGRGVDNLITDDPATARRILQQRAELGFPQRVLLGVAEWVGFSPSFSSQ